jgi:acetoin utilization protein AcuC
MTAKCLPPVFVGHELYRRTGYGNLHPLAIPRVGAVMDLCRALGWLGDSEFQVSPRATDAQLAWFHAPHYIAALRDADAAGKVDIAVRERYAIGTMENPLFAGVFERAATSVGGSIRAAELALEGRTAYHPPGGTHHGRPDRASGFCYFNDPVFALLALLRGGLERMLYVDLDAHHGDAVQDAFAADPRVFTISIHERGRWPHTGDANDVALGRACNLPVPPAFADAELQLLMDRLVVPLAARLEPQAIVLTCGADVLAGDPLSSMRLSNVALWSAIERLVAMAPAAVVLGGGGYNPWTVARYWSGIWAKLSGRPIPAALPQAARAVLGRLQCDLVDDEDIEAAWVTTIADEPGATAVRDEIVRLCDDARARVNTPPWQPRDAAVLDALRLAPSRRVAGR